ncbi:M4 family metallopeptidase [Patescibacteria group bacterium]|nr:M4 family metallopeptidase [Patescibacteria group bacterium]
MKKLSTSPRWVTIGGSLVLGAVLLGGVLFYTQARLSTAQAEESLISASPAVLANKGLDYKVDRSTGQVDYIASQTGSIPIELTGLAELSSQTVADQFLAEYGSYFGLRDPATELAVVENKQDKLKMSHAVYNQLYKGLPVFGGQLIVHLDSTNAIQSANGQVIPNVDLDVNPKINQESAADKAKQKWQEQFKLNEAQVISTGLKVFNRGLLENKSGQPNQLVWEIELYDKGSHQHEYYYIDAQRGDLIYQITGRKDIYRRTTDCSRGSYSCDLDILNGGYYYGRSEGQPVRGANPLYGLTDVDDLYDMMGSTHQYFSDTYGRDGANDQGGLGDDVYSAYGNTDGYTYIDYYPIDQGCPNAYNDGFSINFCEGLVYNDVVGHEYGHGVVNFSVSNGLTYAYESGALHEAYADIFGEALEYYRTGANDWLMGAEINVPGLSSPIRSLIDPGSVNSGLGFGPETFYDSNFYCGSGDGGGVHHNSTVVSHAAYLMAMGGTHNGCTISAIGRDKEEQIYYRALTTYFTSSTDFNDAYTALNSACTDLYGSASDECVNTRQALQAVEIDQGGACSSQARTTPICAVSTTSSPPTITNQSPADGDTVVDKDSDIYLETHSNAIGINPSSLNVTIEGRAIISSGLPQTGHDVTFDYNNSGGYDITINPNSSFSYGQSVQVVARAADYNGNLVSSTWSFTVVDIDPKILSTSGPGEITRLQAYNRQGSKVGSEIGGLFPTSYTGGAGIVAIDQSNNGVKDQFLIFAASNGGPQARVMGLRSDGSTVLKGQMFVFNSSIRDGLSMVAGDFDSDGFEDDVAACLTGDRAPEVRIYKDATGTDNWQLLNRFTAAFGSVGCNLSTFQYDTGVVELLVTPHHGPASPKVYIYTVGGTLKKRFTAYGSGVTNGLTPSGIEDRIYTTPNNGSSQVLAFDRNGTQKNFWWAYAEHVRGDFKNVPGDIDLDGKDEILISPIGANGPQVLAFEATGKWRTWPNFFAFGDETLRNGVGIAVVENWHGVN